MTKEIYFEMCEQLGTEPVDSEIPIELEDFPDLIQQLLSVYNILKDCWEPMGGTYLGKDYAIVFELFKHYRIETSEEILLSLDLLQHIDGVRSKIISSKIKSPAS